MATRDFVSAGLLPLAEKAFLRCIARVLQHNRPDAWDYVGTGADTPAHRQSRLAWTELFMCPKTCLGVIPGGRAKQRRNHNLAANRLERWNLGERRALWDEGVAGRRHHRIEPPQGRDPEQRQ